MITQMQYILERQRSLHPIQFSIWVRMQADGLLELEKEQLITAHSEGIRFMSGNTAIPQSVSEEWYSNKYEQQ